MGSDQLFHRNKIRKAKDLARHAAKKSPYEMARIFLTWASLLRCPVDT